MSRGVIASSQSYTAFSTFTIRRRCCFTPHTRSRLSFPNPISSPCSLKSSRTSLRCNSNSGGNDCKSSDAYLLGKAVSEVLTERVESSMAEIRAFFEKWPTNQLKYLIQFQEEVLERVVRDKAAAALGEASSTVKEAVHEVQDLITSATEQAAQGLIAEAGSTVERATQIISEAASTVEHATQLVSEATSTVEQATQEAHELISEASSTVKDATKGVVSEAASTIEQAASQAQGLITEATSTAKLATDEANDLLSGAASTEEVMERVVLDKEAAALGEASSTVKEAVHEVQDLITSTTEQGAQGLMAEAGSTVERETQVISEAASTVEHATQLVSEATSTVEQATQEAHELISEASSTVKDATKGVVSEAASTVEQAASQAQGLISEATSTAKLATDEAKDLLSGAASTVSDVSKTISSVTDSVSSLLKPKKFL